MAAYPLSAGARDAFIVSRRPARPVPDPWRAHGVTVEHEPTDTGELAEVVTVFLTGRECPWRCAMCDLWKYTTETDTPAGAIPHQIRSALQSLPDVAQAFRLRATLRRTTVASAEVVRPAIKLYNAGSFFDPRAVPPADYRAIATAVTGFSRVIVESHPALVGARIDDFLEALAAEATDDVPRLEVAMGLETAHPDALERLNKRMTVDQFRNAASELGRRHVALRVFVLVAPPFVPAGEQAEWLRRSVDLAFDAGATAVSLIPMRGGNGTVEVLGAQELFTPPTLDVFDDAMDAALERARRRVFADLWDLERLTSCGACFAGRKARLEQMNLTQRPAPRVSCATCSVVEVRA